MVSRFVSFARKVFAVVLMVFAVVFLCACPRAFGGDVEGTKSAVDKAGAEAHYKKAVDLQAKGKLDAAVGEYIDAIEITPTMAQYYTDLGEAYRELGKYEMAIIVLERAINIDPAMANALTSLGVIYEDRGQFDKAIEYNLKAVKADPKNAVAYANLGHAYDRAGKAKDAEESYRNSIEINPNFAAAYDNYGALLMANGRTDEGLLEVKLAIETAGANDPQLGLYYNDLGAAYVMKKDYKASCEAFGKALALLPDNAAIKQNVDFISKYCK